MTKNKGWEKTKTLSWEEKRVGDANDKARDHFTVGEIEFIKKTIAQELRGLMEKVKDDIEFRKRVEMEFRRDIKDSYGEEMVRATCDKILAKINQRLKESK